MAGPNVIYRGPATDTPITVNNLPVAAADMLPGTIVVVSGGALTTAGADPVLRPLVLGVADYVGQDPDTAYQYDSEGSSGDTGVAYEARPNDVFSVRMAAGTYTAGQALTFAANGRLAAAAATEDRVAAYFADKPGTLTAGDRADVIIANSFTNPQA